MKIRIARSIVLMAVSIVPLLSMSARAQTADKRPMTFLDAQLLRQVAAPAPSVDGRWLLYTLSTMDWKEAKRQTDIVLVSLDQGVPSTKQLTFTKDKNETQPHWSRDGSVIVFRSSRSGTQEIWAADGDGSHQRQVTHMGNTLSGSPKISRI